MLRKQPRVETAVVTNVNGSRFFDLYIPSLGLEARINTNEIVPAVDATWDANLRCATFVEHSLTIHAILDISDVTFMAPRDSLSFHS